MLTVISPAKTLDFDTPAVTRKFSQPTLINQSRQLVTLMRKQSTNDLQKMMGISHKLAELNVDRFKHWKSPFTPDNAKQSVLAFRGDVYIGLDADTYSERDFNFAQKHLRILSGLYGVLKPLDLIQPYRLEMGTRIENRRGKDLYEFWGNRIAKSLSEELDNHSNGTLINLASNEYFKSVQTDKLCGGVVTPIFKDFNRGAYKVMSFFAKKARGSMASFMIRERIDRPEGLKDFNTDGYGFDASRSSDKEWVFTRKAP